MAESEILRGQSWSPRHFRAAGAVHVEVMGSRGVQVGLEVDGLGGQLRKQRPSTGAFALDMARDGVTFQAIAGGGDAFPGGAAVDLALSFPATGRTFLIERVDVSGHRRAPLVELVQEGDLWRISSAVSIREDKIAAYPDPTGAPREGRSTGSRETGTSIPAMLGSWYVRRSAENGQPLRLELTEIMIDNSASMTAHRARAALLVDLLDALLRAAEDRAAEITVAPVGGVEENGVGSAHVQRPAETGAASGPRVLITDLPGRRADGVASLVIGEEGILQALGGPVVHAHIVGDTVWQQLQRSGADFDDSTLQRMAPLVHWLEDLSSDKDAVR